MVLRCDGSGAALCDIHIASVSQTCSHSQNLPSCYGDAQALGLSCFNALCCTSSAATVAADQTAGKIVDWYFAAGGGVYKVHCSLLFMLLQSRFSDSTAVCRSIVIVRDCVLHGHTPPTKPRLHRCAATTICDYIVHYTLFRTPRHGEWNTISIIIAKAGAHVVHIVKGKGGEWAIIQPHRQR